MATVKAMTETVKQRPAILVIDDDKCSCRRRRGSSTALISRGGFKQTSRRTRYDEAANWKL